MRPKRMFANHTLSPLHGWSKAEDLQKPKYAPWNELLWSKLIDAKEIPRLSLDEDNNYVTAEYDESWLIDKSISFEASEKAFKQSRRNPKINRYALEDLVFIKWRSSQESWSHLAGRMGYVVISISEKKQIDFIITVMN